MLAPMLSRKKEGKRELGSSQGVLRKRSKGAVGESGERGAGQIDRQHAVSSVGAEW